MSDFSCVGQHCDLNNVDDENMIYGYGANANKILTNVCIVDNIDKTLCIGHTSSILSKRVS